MTGFYDRLHRQVKGGSAPPVSEWSPELSGDIDILIDANGNWFHEGSQIQRAALVALFAKILRREHDGDYYLVTPVEKWRIRVEGHALVVDTITQDSIGIQPVWIAEVNNGLSYPISEHYPLRLDERGQGAFMGLPNGLTARLSRNAWYHLCDSAYEFNGSAVVESAGTVFRLG